MIASRKCSWGETGVGGGGGAEGRSYFPLYIHVGESKYLYQPDATFVIYIT